MTNLVSVIIPSFNRAKLLPRSIESCFNQTHRDVEVIVIDDGSTDETPEILRELTERWGSDRLRWVRQDNKGACVARNAGLDMVRGEFVQFLDSDDIIHPMKFEKQIKALRNSDFPVAVCDFQYVIGEDNNQVIKQCENTGNLWEKVANFRSLSIFTPLIRADSINKTLRWNTDIKRNQDMDFMLRYFIGIRGWVYTPGIWSYYIQHKDPQIRDTYKLSRPQYFELFKSLHNYWLLNKSLIPVDNYWMVRQFAFIMSRALLNKGERKLAGKLALYAMWKPFNMERINKSCRIFVKSFISGRFYLLIKNYRRTYKQSNMFNFI